MRIKIAHTILRTYHNEQRLLTARTYLGRRPPQTGKARMQKLLWAQMQTRESAPTSHHGVKNLQAAGFTAVSAPTLWAGGGCPIFEILSLTFDNIIARQE